MAKNSLRVKHASNAKKNLRSIIVKSVPSTMTKPLKKEFSTVINVMCVESVTVRRPGTVTLAVAA